MSVHGDKGNAGFQPDGEVGQDNSTAIWLSESGRMTGIGLMMNVSKGKGNDSMWSGRRTPSPTKNTDDGKKKRDNDKMKIQDVKSGLSKACFSVPDFCDEKR